MKTALFHHEGTKKLNEKVTSGDVMLITILRAFVTSW
jgi:hypothetical protein